MLSVRNKWVPFTAVGALLVGAAVVTTVGPTDVVGKVFSYLSNPSQAESNEYLIQTWVTSPDGVRRLKSEYYASSGEMPAVASTYYDEGPGRYEVQVSVKNKGVTHWGEEFTINIE